MDGAINVGTAQGRSNFTRKYVMQDVGVAHVRALPRRGIGFDPWHSFFAEGRVNRRCSEACHNHS